MKTAAAKTTEIPTVDLRDEICPMSFVKAKLHMERLGPGELIEFVLLPGEQIQNVPRSLKEEGHKIEDVRREGETYHLLVRKSQ